MPVCFLSLESLRRISCPIERTHEEFFDSALKGFYVDVQRNGRMHYRVRYRVEKKFRVLTLGDARVLPLDEARVKARDALYAAAAGVDPKKSNFPGKDLRIKDFFLDQYLPYVRTYKRSWKIDESLIRNHVLPRFGQLSLRELNAASIAVAINAMRDAGYAPGTCNRVTTLMHYGFKLAIRWEIPHLNRNPLRDLKPIREDNRIERFLDRGQTRALLESASNSSNWMLLYIIQFLLLTGARKREVLDAKWEDVDLAQSLWRIPKTKSGKVRHVPLSDGAVNLLHDLKIRSQPAQGIHVFANPNTGKPFVSIHHGWDAVRKQAGMPNFRMHDLRHSFASFLVNGGRSLYEVQQLLGHADIRTTSRYAHLSRQTLRDAVESVPLDVRLAQ